MKFYSEKLNKLFDTSKELKEAEKALEVKEQEKEALKAKRAERAKEIEDITKDIVKLQQQKDKMVAAFVEDYGSFHQTIRQGDPHMFSDELLQNLWNLILQ